MIVYIQINNRIKVLNKVSDKRRDILTVHRSYTKILIYTIVSKIFSVLLHFAKIKLKHVFIAFKVLSVTNVQS